MAPGQGSGPLSAPSVQPPDQGWLECVVNVSEGRDTAVLDQLAAACGPTLLDVHSDPDHHRTVFTLGGYPDEVLVHAQALARGAVERLDIRAHSGAHPRLGVVDVVPFVGLPALPVRDDHGTVAAPALRARDRWAGWAAGELELPVFVYGPERSLPEVRRHAWEALRPDYGPQQPHPTAGAVCVGARAVLVAYNIWLEAPDLHAARQVAGRLRSPEVRALGLAVGGEVQVSCNLVAPWRTGPAEVWDAVSSLVPARRGELVGLLPRSVLSAIPRSKWDRLGLSDAATIESAMTRGCAWNQ